MTGLFDTHAHYDDEAFRNDREQVIGSLANFGVKRVVNVGSSLETSESSVKIAESHDGFYCSVGIHPEFCETDGTDKDAYEKLAGLLNFEKCVAVGEIGLDYHYTKENAEIQKKVFISQLELAGSRRMPVIVHEREAHGDTMEILREFSDVKCVVHSFSGSLEMAYELFGMGHYISVNGVVTFKNARKIREILTDIGTFHKEYISRILIETDCPYLTPEPNRGKRNDSSNIRYTCAELARLLGITPDEAASRTFENGNEFYMIGD